MENVLVVRSRSATRWDGGKRRRRSSVVAHAALLIVLAGLFGAVGLCGLAAPAHAAVSYVKVDGKTVYSAAKGVKTAQVKGVSYNAGKAVLTVKNLKLTTKAPQAVCIVADADDSVKIKLKGSNIISAAKAGVSGVWAGCRLVFDGSGLTMNSMDTAVNARSIVMKDGAYAFRRCVSAGIVGCDSVKIPAKNIGTVSVATLNPSKTAAIVATLGKVSSAPERLGTIAGRLGKGARFQHANSFYTVLDEEQARLTCYSGGKEADLEAVTYGKYGYDITEICSGAFDNRVGRKVTKIVLGSNTRVIEADAFKGTNLLTNLDMKRLLNNVDVRNWRTLLDTVTSGIDRKAFRGCGALSGARLTVHTSFSNADVNIAIKGAMTIKGMPLLARFRK